jgi:N-acetyl-1-D-myo-inositol-2-amino-2-deoxy-alpha-D-glucopyranoside deacetylase
MSDDAATRIDADRRLLLVHAHPDDETIANGATMAKYAAEGAHVTLVTCTLGEMGEVLVPELAHLAAEREDGLGQHRIGELAEAMELLGVTDHRFLGGPGRYRDSGMAETEDGAATAPAEVRPDSFWRADLLEASNYLVEVIREVRPQVLTTYDELGAYGHPDHVQAHRVAMYAAVLAAVPSYRLELGQAWEIPKIYWNAMSEGRLREGLRILREMGDKTTFEGMEPDGPLPSFVTPDKWLTADIDGTDYVDQKMKAMAAHATQIAVDGPFFALSNNLGNMVWGTESYRLVKGSPGDPDPETGLENDLFAGLD